MSKSSRQAVLLIHGIGEQRPMDTLRGFVRAVWTLDTEIHNPFAGHDVWSKPDSVSHSFELRRLTTPQNANGIRTDFFEFYWAHLMEGTTFGHVFGWARSLLLRDPRTVPKQLRLAYWVVIGLCALALAIAIVAWTVGRDRIAPAVVWTVVSVLLVPLAGFVLKSIVGDAARYLDPAPHNVQRRHEIRHAGVELLKTLHTRGYDRIIVVGHSLGTVIGYDILTHAWPLHNQVVDAAAEKQIDALEALEATARNPESGVERARQRAYFEELRANGNTWRVTDFVTMGSPLAHAELLMAHDRSDLRAKQAARELPTCLPWLEEVVRDKVKIGRFSFDAEHGHRLPNHAAVFAPTRWTNLYFPASWLIKGDLIGGPVAPVFGRGIRDVAVTTTQRGGLLGHTLYWTCPDSAPAPGHIAELRRALDLTDSRPMESGTNTP
jgi:hypothetical protein